MFAFLTRRPKSPAWNKGKIVGQKPPLKMQDVWAIRTRLQMTERRRDLALFNLAIDSKLRGCDLIRLKVGDVMMGDCVSKRANIIQHKTGRPSIRDHHAPSKSPIRMDQVCESRGR